MKRPRSPLLLDVVAWIAGRGRITEGWLSAGPSSKVWVYGLAMPREQPTHVMVNPVPSTLDTVIHEVLHALHPTWTERGVLRKTKALMRQMNDAEIQKLWEIYQDRLKREKKRGRRNAREHVDGSL